MKKLENNALILFFAIAVCVALALYAGYIKGVAIVYTHFFYIPILLTGMWYKKKAILVGLFFGLVHISITYFSLYSISINEFGRAVVFISVAYVVGYVSEARAREENKLIVEMNFSANIIDTVPDSLLVLDGDLNIKSVNRTFCETFNEIKPEKVMGSNIADVLQDKDRKLSIELTKIIGTGELLENFEIYYRSEMPGERTLNISAKEMSLTGDILVVIEDITRRKQAEEELRKTQDYLENLINYANAPIIVWDPEFKITKFNHAFEHLTGFTFDEVTGRRLGMLFPEESLGRSFSKIKSTSKGKYWESEEIPVLHKDGDIHTVLWNSANIYSKEGTLLATIAQGQDISERKRAEDELKNSHQKLKDTHVQLLQAGKLTAMGEMAAGVVHELTQPLLGIKGFAAVLLEDMKSNLENGHNNTLSDFNAYAKQVISDLEVILQQTDRLTRLVKNVRSFARESKTEKVLLCVNRPVEDALMLFSEQLRIHNIAVDKNLARDLPGVTGNPDQMEQVFINLIINARDAMDAKGRNGQLMIKTWGSDNSIHIEFEDTGTGADAETVIRMFEPFFTTRVAGEGTGLGLSIVKRIIDDHNGTIDAQCEPGRGCKFTIHLPAALEGEY